MDSVIGCSGIRRERWPDLKIVVTTDGNAGEVTELETLSAGKVLPKPYGLGELRQLLLGDTKGDHRCCCHGAEIGVAAPRKNPCCGDCGAGRFLSMAATTGRGAPCVGLYARVSTHDQQSLPMQLATMRAHAKHRGSRPPRFVRPPRVAPHS